MASFSKSDNIVTDSTTGLQWQDDAVGNTMPWEEAIAYCKALELDTYSDWRLPNVNELKTIVDRSKYNPAIVSGFTNFGSSYYWSSTSSKDSTYIAWIVHFYFGGVYNSNKNDSYYVRCVRAGE
jgi:hypothetical protein